MAKKDKGLRERNRNQEALIADLRSRLVEISERELLWIGEVDALRSQVNELLRNDTARDALVEVAAKEAELVQQAEAIGRAAGNRMDALEKFYNDLLAGSYDVPGWLPYAEPELQVKMCPSLHATLEEEEACEARRLRPGTAIIGSTYRGDYVAAVAQEAAADWMDQ